MYSAIRGAFTTQGLITNEQAQVAGLSDDQIRVLLRDGSWVKVRRGVYAERELWQTLDEHRGRPLLRAHAAHLTMVTEHVMSHDSAALLLDLDHLRPDPELVHITRPDVRGSRTAYGVKHHGAVYPESCTTTADGVGTLDLARTAIDLGREHGYRHGLVACDSARRLGVRLADLERAHAIMDNWPHIRPARAAVRDSVAGAESVAETLTRELVGELGLGLPVITQFPVRVSDGRVAWIDLLVGLHGFEFDGKIKILTPAEGGVAERPAAEVLWEEKKRERLVCAEGLGMSHVIWSDFWGSQRPAAISRLRAEFRVTEQRYGTELPPHLRLFAERVRPQRVPAA